MIRFLSVLLFSAAIALSQQPAPAPAPPGGPPKPPAIQLSDEEQQNLRTVVSANATSEVDLMRALEDHLLKFPNSPQRDNIERAILKSAVELRDEKRLVTYATRILARDPDDLELLDRVSRALLARRDKDSAKQALVYATRMQAFLEKMAQTSAAPSDAARRKDDLDRGMSRAILFQAIANENLGEFETAVTLARKSFDAFPSSEPAAELARCLAQMGKVDAAIEAYADAFTVPDTRLTDIERSVIRRRIGELYQKQKGTEAGLGELILHAYDRNSALVSDRRLALKQFDPNFDITDPLQYTVTSITGEKLQLSSLLGKVVIMDFWATWCGPCRVQHPLYEEVKKKFAGNQDVVFLAINTDEDHALVQPFLKSRGWNNAVYFEDGLSRNLRVSSIPTTLVFDKQGKLSSRMNGFDPERFVAMLTERIQDALR